MKNEPTINPLVLEKECMRCLELDNTIGHLKMRVEDIKLDQLKEKIRTDKIISELQKQIHLEVDGGVS